MGLGLRAAHLATVGTLLGGHVFGVDESRLVPWLLASLLTGVGLVILEVARTVTWLTTVKGLAVAAKMALLGTALVFPGHRAEILFATVVFAAVTAHMPGRFRHFQVVPAWRATTADRPPVTRREPPRRGACRGHVIRSVWPCRHA